MTRTITAFFDTLAEAERAAQDLSINVGGVRGEVYDTKRSGELSRLPIPGEDVATFDEGIRRGGATGAARLHSVEMWLRPTSSKRRCDEPTRFFSTSPGRLWRRSPSTH